MKAAFAHMTARDFQAAQLCTEHDHQCALFRWAAEMSERFPILEFMFAIPNAGAGAQRGQAGKLRAEGVKSGVPDIFIPCAKGGFYGLFIEMKVGRNKPSAQQKKWIAYLRGFGYRVEVCYGVEEAKRVILDYLGQEITQ
ncbi:MAG: VRR-NUC domain-containing protein [Acidobacteriota bacterium]